MSGIAVPRLPHRRQKPYIPRPERTAAVTIAAGFRCNDGIVLCADRLIAHGGPNESGSFAHYEPKVFAIENYSSFGAVACGAGDASLIRPIAESFLTALKTCKQPDEIRMSLCKSILEDTLNDFTAKIANIPEVHLLIAASDDKGRQQFLRCEGLVVHPANNVEILGLGENSLVRYLIDSIYKEDMDISELATLATLIVDVAKKYCPQYCGGQTDVYMLSKKYEFFADPAPLPEIVVQKLEESFARTIPAAFSALIKTLTFQ